MECPAQGGWRLRWDGVYRFLNKGRFCRAFKSVDMFRLFILARVTEEKTRIVKTV